MPQYLISIGAHAMDHIPEEDMPAVGDAAHDVVREALRAGVWVTGGRMEDESASFVAPDGKVGDGPCQEAIGGFSLIDVLSRAEALEWAAKWASACRCVQEVREFGPDPVAANWPAAPA